MIVACPTPEAVGYNIQPKSSVHAYKDTSHKWLNRALREGDYPRRMHAQGQAEFEAHYHNLMSLMLPAEQSMTLWRGVSLPVSCLSRRSFIDPAFLSTSLSRKQASRFTAPGYNDHRRTLVPAMLRIHAPQGSLHADLDSGPERNFYTGHEQEILLPPGSKLILGLRWRQKDGIWRVNAKLASRNH